MTSPLRHTTRIWILMTVLCLSACAGKPTPDRCNNPQTTTTACKIPSPPIVEKKVLFDETLSVTPLKVTYPRPTASAPLIKRKPNLFEKDTKSTSNNIKLYTVQFGAFRQPQSSTTLRKLRNKSSKANMYQYSLSSGLSGMSVGRFNSIEDARSLEQIIQKNIAADAYIRILPEDAKMIDL